ncbi:hypothetical protein OAI83_01625 [Nitrosopumilus sp.]|nr:hypothetical protein [Nitrosopumilus sp.]
MNRIKEFIKEKQCTLLGIGPMSKNCVDVVIELVNSHKIPIMLIASRRQIESAELGGGYVNNWTTEEFSKYIEKNDKNQNIILCRDHGGPYQNENENKENHSFDEVMDNAKKSFSVDIQSNFQIIHIDPTENLVSDLTQDEMLNRIYDLYEFCYLSAEKFNKKIFVEISLGKEDGGISSVSEIEYGVKKIKEFCNKNKLPLPLFMVVKTGNHVLETKNIGILEDIVDGKGLEEGEIKKMIKFCNEEEIMIKEHNGDYLAEHALRYHPKIGIHGINVAPEFGVIETKAILTWLEQNNLYEMEKKFIDIAYNSKKWEKWMMPNSKTTKKDKAIIAGHYIFSSKEFEVLKNEILETKEKEESFNNFLKSQIRISIVNYLKNLNII